MSGEKGQACDVIAGAFLSLSLLHMFSCVCLCGLRSSLQGTFCKVFLVTAHHLLNHSSQLSVLVPKIKHELGIKHILKSGPVFRSTKLHGLCVCWIRRLSEVTEVWGPRA